MATRQCKMKYRVCIVFLLDTAGLEPLRSAHASGAQPCLRPGPLSIFTCEGPVSPARVSTLGTGSES